MGSSCCECCFVTNDKCQWKLEKGVVGWVMCYNFEDKLDFGTVAGHIFEAFKSGVFY